MQGERFCVRVSSGGGDAGMLGCLHAPDNNTPLTIVLLKCVVKGGPGLVV